MGRRRNFSIVFSQGTIHAEEEKHLAEHTATRWRVFLKWLFFFPKEIMKKQQNRSHYWKSRYLEMSSVLQNLNPQVSDPVPLSDERGEEDTHQIYRFVFVDVLQHRLFLVVLNFQVHQNRFSHSVRGSSQLTPLPIFRLPRVVSSDTLILTMITNRNSTDEYHIVIIVMNAMTL